MKIIIRYYIGCILAFLLWGCGRSTTAPSYCGSECNSEIINLREIPENSSKVSIGLVFHNTILKDDAPHVLDKYMEYITYQMLDLNRDFDKIKFSIKSFESQATTYKIEAALDDHNIQEHIAASQPRDGYIHIYIMHGNSSLKGFAYRPQNINHFNRIQDRMYNRLFISYDGLKHIGVLAHEIGHLLGEGHPRPCFQGEYKQEDCYTHMSYERFSHGFSEEQIDRMTSFVFMLRKHNIL